MFSFLKEEAVHHWFLLHFLLRFRVVPYEGAQFFLGVYLLPAQ